MKVFKGEHTGAQADIIQIGIKSVTGIPGKAGVVVDVDVECLIILGIGGGDPDLCRGVASAMLLASATIADAAAEFFRVSSFLSFSTLI